jgi:Cu+-exporting ATPase
MKRLSFCLLLPLLAACGGAEPTAAPPATAATPAASAAASTAALVAPGAAKVGDKTRCPVSGEEFVVAADSPKADYQGKTYYFCCPGCDKKFTADPQKFLSKLGG